MLERIRSSIDVRPVIFLAIFALTALFLMVLPTTNVFWRVMDLRFSKDERYQLQSLFLPDRRRLVPLAVVGDSMFQEAVTTQAGPLDAAPRIVINGYDSDDVDNVLATIQGGQSYTKTRVCTVMLQISPNFAVRAKSQHVPQSYGMLQIYAGQGKAYVRIRNFFSTIDSWFHTQDDGDLTKAPHLRVASHVGQTRFADPAEENWKRAFRYLKRAKVRVLGVLDVRGTDWGEEGNLVQETERLLNQLSESSDTFSWVRLEEFSASKVPACPQRAASVPDKR